MTIKFTDANGRDNLWRFIGKSPAMAGLERAFRFALDARDRLEARQAEDRSQDSVSARGGYDRPLL
jgi:hypothetical protein